MLLEAITDGSTTGTGAFELHSYLFGGVLITADGANDATVIVRRNDAAGKQIFNLVTKTAGLIAAPISTEGTRILYYSISGTGAAAQFYEWTV